MNVNKPFYTLLLSGLLSACGGDKSQSNNPNPSNASNVAIASAVLNVAQGQDILQSSKQAMHNINASDIAAVQQQASMPILSLPHNSTSAIQAASDTELPKLPESCERYYQRVTTCFTQQNDAAALLAMTQEQRTELAHDQPDEATCQTLNSSFDRVAYHLACE
ncbi:MAG: hypothetical protein Q4B82_01830 [Alysiella sp.]|uniref:hypothetical protein n=1 Tax=Alysiella sp. TaxID=1872483 RepID=UPI0026DAF894|nr:hypothetical protein [Alysiella sp.]MDO4433302.1 hypothetical protein [Alysiella sp.]